MAITGRLIIPRDIFVVLCVEVKKLSDALLASATTLQHEAQHLPAECKTLDHLLAANTQLSLVEQVRRSILYGNDNANDDEGGNECHVN